MEVEKLLEQIDIPENATVRVKKTGNVIEVMYMMRRSSGGYITKIDKDRYVDNRTGEVREFEHTDRRKDDIRAVRDSLRQGRDIINTNVSDASKCRWITLTYKENMTDSQKLYRDFDNFNRRCRERYGHYEYITAVEPQGRGAWHMHVLMIFNDNAPYMDNSIVSRCWGQGFVNVNSLKDIDNVGAYLTAYLGDVELTDENMSDLIDGDINDTDNLKTYEFEDENGNKNKKRYIKGARLKMYPKGFHIFRWSRGIKKPDISLMDYKTAKEKVHSAKQTFSKTLILDDVSRNFKNILRYEYYNIMRK